MNLSDNLKSLRKLHNLTLQQLSSQLGILHQQYWRYEQGLRELPLSLAVKLADIYGITLDELVGRTPPTRLQAH